MLAAPNTERTPQEIEVNNHMKEQPAIKELQAKISNFCKFITESAADPRVKEALKETNASMENMVDLVNKMNETAKEWPYDVVLLINLIGPIFFDPKERIFKEVLFLQMFPTMKEQLTAVPGGEYLQKLDIDKLPLEIRSKTFRYLGCFCDLLCPK